MTDPGRPSDGTQHDASQKAREKQRQQQEQKQKDATQVWNKRQIHSDRKENVEDAKKTRGKVSDWNKPQSADQHIPGDTMGDVLHMASGPKKPSGKIILDGDLNTSGMRKKGLEAPDQLRPHEPKAPPKDVFGPNQYVLEQTKQQPDELPVRDVSNMPVDAPLDSKHDWVFPAETIRRSEQQLSPEERAERKEVAKPNDGMAFGHSKDTPAAGETERWHKQLSPEEQKALPKARVTIYAMASRTGSEAANMKLTERRAEAVANILVDKYGVKRENITVVPLGEETAKDNGAPDGKDNRDDRVAVITIDAGDGQTNKLGDLAKAGTKAGDAGKPPEPPHKTTIQEGLRDAAKDFIVNLVSETLGAVKTMIDSTVKVFTSIGELHDKNKQEAIARGVQFSVAVLGSDVRNPNNPHITQGKTYTVQELEKRVRFTFGKEIQQLMPWMKIENREANKQLQNGIGVVVNHLNQVLGKAKTPVQRQMVIRTFVETVEKQIEEAYKKRGSGGYGSR